MDIRMYNGGLSNQNTTGGRQTDLQKGKGWPQGIPNGQHIVDNHTGVGSETEVRITVGFLSHHPVGAVLTRSTDRTVRITRESGDDTVVVSEQVASVLMFQRQGIELIVGDHHIDTLSESQLHITVTAIERNGARYSANTRFGQVLLALHQLQALLGEDIPEGLRAAIEHFVASWEDPALIRNGTTHDAFLQLREHYATYDDTYTVAEDLVARLTGHSGEEDIDANDTTSEGAALNNTQSTIQQQDTILEDTTPSTNASSTLPQAAKDAIGRRAIVVVMEDLENRGQNVTSVETAAAAQDHLGVDWPGYDLLVDQDLQHEEHIEVKGTRIGGGGNVRLTRVEMQTACTDPRATLAVVSAITCYQNSESEWVAEGGELRYYRWCNTNAIETFLQPLKDGSLPGLSGVLGMNFPLSPTTSELTEEFVR